MIDDDQPEPGMGFVTLGGSRVRIATDAAIQQGAGGRPHRETTDHDCDQRDFRLNVLALGSADQIYSTASASRLEWDLSSPAEDGFRQWMRACRELSLRTGTEGMFLVLTGTSESLPPPDFERAFEASFGMPIITMPEKLHENLARDGK